MIRGRETLTSIESALKNEHNKISEADRLIDETNDRLINLQKEQATGFKELARLKVGLLASGKIISRIDNAEQQVINLLHSRERAKATLDDAIAKSVRERKPLEEERTRQAGQVDQAAKAVDVAEAETQQRLDADTTYQTQRQTAPGS